jgi:hypothetical protein
MPDPTIQNSSVMVPVFQEIHSTQETASTSTPRPILRIPSNDEYKQMMEQTDQGIGAKILLYFVKKKLIHPLKVKSYCSSLRFGVIDSICKSHTPSSLMNLRIFQFSILSIAIFSILIEL